MAKSKSVYTLFDEFLQKFIIERMNCLFQGSNETFEIEDLAKVSKCFVEDAIKGNKNNFNDKLELQFTGESKAKKLFSHLHWLWALPDIDMKGTTKSSFPFEEFKTEKMNEAFVVQDNVGIGGTGQRYHKFKEIKFLIEVTKYLWMDELRDIKEVKDVKKKMVSFIKKESTDRLPIKNALLNLCNRDEYEPIFSSNHKLSIVKAFGWMLKEDNNEDKSDDIDKKLWKIREGMKKDKNFSSDFSFYQKGIRELWNVDTKNVDDLDDVQLLQYKKAIVLYGPPGTSKTYSAMQIAKVLVVRELSKKIKELPEKQLDEEGRELENPERAKLIDDFKTLLAHKDGKNSQQDEVLRKYIGQLQMHVNYNYEDFVAGQVIKDNTVVTQPGYIFKAIENAKKNRDLPYVVILDEINRTDISRVFGEVFSAMEYRGKDITLPYINTDSDPNDSHAEENQNLVLNIPENLYFIGTMNEIDFSLERIDFALRRRFVWVLNTFDPLRLSSILLEKLRTKENISDIEKYCEECENLNSIIKKSPDLGEKYMIGHTFFAEISNILDTMEGQKQWKKAKKVLWQISIRPIIEAYCGSMENAYMEEIIQKCERAFGINEGKDQSAQNKDEND